MKVKIFNFEMWETYPESLAEALIRMGLFADTAIDFKKAIEDSETGFVAGAHHGIGRTMRNKWGFWKEEGELHAWFVEQGLKHPDDMSGVILVTFYRRYHGLDEDVAGQIEDYINFWKNSENDLDAVVSLKKSAPLKELGPSKISQSGVLDLGGLTIVSGDSILLDALTITVPPD